MPWIEVHRSNNIVTLLHQACGAWTRYGLYALGAAEQPIPPRILGMGCWNCMRPHEDPHESGRFEGQLPPGGPRVIDPQNLPAFEFCGCNACEGALRWPGEEYPDEEGDWDEEEEEEDE